MRTESQEVSVEGVFCANSFLAGLSGPCCALLSSCIIGFDVFVPMLSTYAVLVDVAYSI